MSYARAEQRVKETPELEEYRDIILYDWIEGDEHWDWVAAAPIIEILSWAEQIESEGGPSLQN